MSFDHNNKYAKLTGWTDETNTGKHNRWISAILKNTRPVQKLEFQTSTTQWSKISLQATHNYSLSILHKLTFRYKNQIDVATFADHH